MELQWTLDMQVGVEEIDAQHKELFVRINKLRAALGQGRGKDEIDRTIRFLEEYVVDHFAGEERRMAETTYPYAGLHKAEHADFIRDFSLIKEKLERMEREGMITTFAVIEVQRKLYDWLVNHIAKSDKVLGAFIAASR